MGLQWLPRLLYPDKFDTSIADVTKSYYKTFYGYELTDAEVAELTARRCRRTHKRETDKLSPGRPSISAKREGPGQSRSFLYLELRRSAGSEDRMQASK